MILRKRVILRSRMILRRKMILRRRRREQKRRKRRNWAKSTSSDILLLYWRGKSSLKLCPIMFMYIKKAKSLCSLSLIALSP